MPQPGNCLAAVDIKSRFQLLVMNLCRDINLRFKIYFSKTISHLARDETKQYERTTNADGRYDQNWIRNLNSKTIFQNELNTSRISPLTLCV